MNLTVFSIVEMHGNKHKCNCVHVHMCVCANIPICPQRENGNSDTTIVIITPRMQILVPKYYSPLKGIRVPWLILGLRKGKCK